jgi:CIC family chloride channel protein
MTDSQRFLALCMLAGLCCGLAAVAFHLTIHHLFHAWVDRATALSHPITRAAAWILTPAIAGALVGLLLQYVAPGAAGSGIPQTKAAYHLKFGVMSLRDAFFRFIAGSLSVGLGNSLGREGPTVHLCSSISSGIGQAFGMAKTSVQSMVPVGMGAGVAAAFNTPIAAITFVFEELLEDFSSKALGGIVVAVVIASVVSRTLLGEHAAFDLDLPRFSSHPWMLVSLVMGPIAGLLGHGFVTVLMGMRAYFKSRTKLPPWSKPSIGGLVVGLIGYAVYLMSGGHSGVFSIGYEDLSLALNGNLLLGVALLLLIGKLTATSLVYASGGSGGIFAPVLFMGGMLGAVMGGMLDLWFPIPEGVTGACALLGMGCFFAAVIRSPMTSILIIFEMTRNYSLILPLMAGNILAYAVASKLRRIPIYDALLLQDKISLKKMPTYRGDRDWRNLPVSVIMTHDVITLRESQPLQVAWNRGKAVPRHHAYPLMDDQGKLSGMITRAELTLTESTAHTPELTVGQAAGSRNPVVVHPDTSIREAARVMVTAEVEQVPVVSRNDPQKLIGIVTLHDIARQQNAIEQR